MDKLPLSLETDRIITYGAASSRAPAVGRRKRLPHPVGSTSCGARGGRGLRLPLLSAPPTFRTAPYTAPRLAHAPPAHVATRTPSRRPEVPVAPHRARAT